MRWVVRDILLILLKRLDNVLHLLISLLYHYLEVHKTQFSVTLNIVIVFLKNLILNIYLWVVIQIHKLLNN